MRRAAVPEQQLDPGSRHGVHCRGPTRPTRPGRRGLAHRILAHSPTVSRGALARFRCRTLPIPRSPAPRREPRRGRRPAGRRRGRARPARGRLGGDRRSARPTAGRTSLARPCRILLTSRFAMWMAWGPDLTFFCNDAYRRDTLGEKYPWALGRSARDVWAEIWPDIGPRIDAVMRTGEATWDEALLLFLERSGYTEETYHTFSYSPLHDDDGAIAGMLCVVSEDTERVIGERHMATLRDLGSDTTTVAHRGRGARRRGRGTSRATSARCRSRCSTSSTRTATTARLAGASGIRPGAPAAPAVLDVDDPDAVWPVAALAAGESVLLEDLDGLADLPTGAWDEPPQPGARRAAAAAGPAAPVRVPRRRAQPLPRRSTTRTASFVGLVAGQVAAGIATARAYEAERRRAEQLAELDRAKTAFFTNVSHEFRTPLTLLLGPAEDALPTTTAPLPADQRERVEVVQRNAQRLLKLVNTLLDFSRLEAGRHDARASSRSTSPATRPSWRACSARPSSAPACTLDVDCPPLPAAGLRRPRHVGEDRPEPAVERVEVHVRGRRRRSGSTSRRRRRARSSSPTPASASTRPSRRSCSSASTACPAPARAPTRAPGIGLALVAELAGAARRRGRRSRARRARAARSRSRCRSARATCPPTRSRRRAATATDGRRRGAEGFLAEALRWLDRTPDGPVATGPRRRATAPRVLVVDDNADMRDYVARCSPDDYRVADGAPTARPRCELARARPARPRPHRRDDARARRLRPARRAARRPRHARTCRSSCSRRARARRRRSRASRPAPTTTSSSRSRRASCSRASAPTSSSTASGAPATELERSRELLDQAQRLAGVGSWELDLATGEIRGSAEFLRQLAHDRGRAARPGGLEARSTAAPPRRPRARRAARSRPRSHGAPLDDECRVVPRRRPAAALPHHRRRSTATPTARRSVLRGSNQDVTEQREAEQARASPPRPRRPPPASTASPTSCSAASCRPLDLRPRAPRGRHVLPRRRRGHPGRRRLVRRHRARRRAHRARHRRRHGPRRARRRRHGPAAGRGPRLRAARPAARRHARAPRRRRPGPRRGPDRHLRLRGLRPDATARSSTPTPGTCRRCCARPAARAARSPAAAPPLGSGPLTSPSTRSAARRRRCSPSTPTGSSSAATGAVDAGIDALADGAPGGERADRVAARRARRRAAARRARRRRRRAARPGRRRPRADARRRRSAIAAEARSVGTARGFVAATRCAGGTSRRGRRRRRACCSSSELATNAVLHGRPPIQLRLRHGARPASIEVYDGTAVLPRKLRPTPDDEHGRGLQLVSSLRERWGTRPLPHGKSVWCMLELDRAQPGTRTAAPSRPPARRSSSASSASLERIRRHVRAHRHARGEVEQLARRRRG